MVSQQAAPSRSTSRLSLAVMKTVLEECPAPCGFTVGRWYKSPTPTLLAFLVPTSFRQFVVLHMPSLKGCTSETRRRQRLLASSARAFQNHHQLLQSRCFTKKSATMQIPPTSSTRSSPTRRLVQTSLSQPSTLSLLSPPQKHCMTKAWESHA